MLLFRLVHMCTYGHDICLYPFRLCLQLIVREGRNSDWDTICSDTSGIIVLFLMGGCPSFLIYP